MLSTITGAASKTLLVLSILFLFGNSQQVYASHLVGQNEYYGFPVVNQLQEFRNVEGLERLPQNHSVVASWEGYIYFVAVDEQNQGMQVWRGIPQADGSISNLTQLPSIIGDRAGCIRKGPVLFIYYRTIIAICPDPTGTSERNFYTAQILSNGDLSAWSTTRSTFPTNETFIDLKIAQTPSTTAVLKTKEDAEKVREQNEPRSKVENTWSQSLPADLPSTSFISQFTPLPNRQGRFYADTMVHNGYVYTVGGEYDFFRDGQLYSDIDYSIVSARIRSDSSVGPWREYPYTSIPLSGPPYIRINPSVVVVNDTLFSIGGHRDRGIVYAARISSDANLGPWSELEPLPEAFELTKVVSNRNFIFVLGGQKVTGGGVWDDCCDESIYRTRTHSDGTINGWTHIADLPKELFFRNQYPYIAAYVNNDYLYVAGNGKIFFTSMNSDGSLGPWQGPIDSPTRASSLLVYNNLLVAFGLNNGIYSIPINSDGSLGVPGTVDNGWRADRVQLPLGTANILFDPFIENNRLYLYVSNVDLYFYPAVPPRAFYVANLSNSPTGPVPSPVPVPPPDISIRNAANDSLIATWIVPTANRGTWLSIARTSDQSNQYISRVWANTCRGGNDEPTNISLQISAECTLPKPSTLGTYEVRLYQENNNYTISARSSFTVAAPTPTPTTTPTATPTPTPTIPPARISSSVAKFFIWIDWRVHTPNKGSWIAIARTTDPDNRYVRKFFANNCRSVYQPANLTPKTSGRCGVSKPGPGTYEVRLYSTNNFTVTARSAQFSIQ